MQASGGNQACRYIQRTDILAILILKHLLPERRVRFTSTLPPASRFRTTRDIRAIPSAIRVGRILRLGSVWPGIRTATQKPRYEQRTEFSTICPHSITTSVLRKVRRSAITSQFRTLKASLIRGKALPEEIHFRDSSLRTAPSLILVVTRTCL